MNENASYAFAIKEPAHWRRLPAGRFTIHGWFLVKEARVIHDLHFVIGRRRYPVVHGLPSPQLALVRPDTPGARHAGFTVEVEVGPGDTEVAFEYLDWDLRWQECWRRPIRVSSLTFAGPVRPRLNLAWLAPLLRRRLQEMAGTTSFPSGASLAQLIQLATAPHFEWTPPPPQHAALDIPRALSTAQFHGIHACGWVFDETQAVRRVYGAATVNGHHAFRHGLAPTEQPWKYAHLPTASHPIFFGVLPVPPAHVGPVVAKVYAEFADGRHDLVLARRTWTTPSPEIELPLPTGRWRDFLAAAESLRARILDAGVDPGPLTDFLRAARKVHRELHDWYSVKSAPFPWEQLTPHERQAQRLAPSPRRLRALYAAEPALGRAAPFIGVAANVSRAEIPSAVRLAASLRHQVFSRWELCLVPDDAKTRTKLEHALGTDTRVSVAAGGATVADALAQLGTDFVTVVPATSAFSPLALQDIARAAALDPAPRALFADEEIVRSDGSIEPRAYPEWSPALALSGTPAGTLLCVHRRALAAAGGWIDGPAAAFDAFLRVTEGADASSVRHVHGYALRRAANSDAALRAAVAQAVAASLARRQLPAEAAIDSSAPAGESWVSLRWKPGVLADAPVTIVIPTRDRLPLLQRCLGQLEKTVDWSHVRLLVVDDGSSEPDAVAFLHDLAQRSDLPVQVLRAGEPGAPFNYARLVNVGTAAATTPLVLHLNNDVDALAPGWLEQLAGWFRFSDTGAVGAKLLFPDGGINHAGIVIDSIASLPVTPFEGVTEELAQPAWLHRVPRDVAAVTGACLLTRADLYRQHGGFDAERFPIAFNDVDYCLRLRAAGHRVIFTPAARLIHHGSQSRGPAFHASEHLSFLATHGEARDPWFNPLWRTAGTAVVPDLSPALPDAMRPRGLRLLVVSHNLSLEGAPLFLHEFVAHAVTVDGCSVDLVAYADGPLRAAYEALGVRITLVDRHPVHASPDRATYEERVGAIRRALDLTRIDLVVANTIVGFWAIELARQAGLPSLWFIHESTRVPRFFAHELMPGMQPVVHAAFRQATRVIFLCAATRWYYDDYNVRDHYRILPGWVDATRIRQYLATTDRATLRRQHGIAPDETVIVNVGTICERKGQRWFLDAVRRLLELRPQPTQVLLVGGLSDLYQEVFQAELERAGLPQVRIVGKTDAVYEFYAIADLAVCSSFEESFPRVILEAMAFGVPVVSTNVHGVPEMLGDRHDGLLVTPGNVEELARTMQDALAHAGTPKDLAPAALSKVLRVYDRPRLLPRHLAIAREAADA